MTQARPVIQYEALVDAYRQRLITDLRGFKSAETADFLDTWVPDDDHVASILNILESAHEAQLSTLSITLSPRTLEVLDIARLRIELGALGQIDFEPTDMGGTLHVSFN